MAKKRKIFEILKDKKIGEGPLEIEVELSADKEMVFLYMHGINLHCSLWLSPEEFELFAGNIVNANLDLKEHLEEYEKDKAKHEEYHNYGLE